MKTALVTGGAKGIGAAVVKMLCEKGYSVAINYNKSEEKAFALSSSLVISGYDAFCVKGDISDPTQANNLIKAVADRNSRIDVLVNNAGTDSWELFDTVSDAEWKRVIDTDLTGCFNCSRAVLPHMIKEKYGRIINIGSVWGQTGASCEVIYSAAKAGVIGMTKALAKEVALSGITVNCVSPGAVDTDMMKRFSEEDIRGFCEEIPMGRLASPEDVAAAVVFFASDEAGYITGQVLGVNGGMV